MAKILKTVNEERNSDAVCRNGEDDFDNKKAAVLPSGTQKREPIDENQSSERIKVKRNRVDHREKRWSCSSRLHGHICKRVWYQINILQMCYLLLRIWSILAAYFAWLRLLSSFVRSLQRPKTWGYLLSQKGKVGNVPGKRILLEKEPSCSIADKRSSVDLQMLWKSQQRCWIHLNDQHRFRWSRCRQS